MGRHKKIIEEKPERRHLHICYVCNHKITGEAVKIASSIKHPDGLYRHVRCEPGSKRWLRSDVGKESEHYDLFEQEA